MIEKEIEINGKIYVEKSTVQEKRESVANKKYIIVRTQSAGVFAGHLKSRNGKEATLLEARRIWYWDGAASLSQLAMNGTSKPNTCKFPQPVDEVILTEVIEMLPCTAKAEKSIKEVPVWKQ